VKRVALLAAVAALALPAASAQGRPHATPRLSVYAAASLTEVFRKIAPNANYNFGGSNQLAFQIRQGAPADVFASASPQYTQDLFKERLVEKPITFASNKLVLAIPRSNPAGLRTVFDLKTKDVKLVVGTPAAPVGSYTRQVLRKLGMSNVLSKVVSQEPDVKSIVGKVALGEADAGFVYRTDIQPVSNRVRAIRIPPWAQPKVRYEIAVVRGSNNKKAARAWIKMIDKSPRARRLLRRAGFGLK
jgi:molybdate transport system substrate-binding protein